MDLSFSGAGFMGCYYFGVVNCWNKYIPRDRVRRVAGASAGSLIAAYYLMDLPLEKCLKEIVEMTEYARSLPLGVFDRTNQIVDVLPQALDKMFPEDAHKLVNGRLYVSMTRLKDFKSVVINQFDSRQDLIDALNCSCFIPVWSGNHCSTYKGVKYIDGGFTNNLPVFDEHTIRVACFSGFSDIAPYDQARTDFLKGLGNLRGLSLDLSWKNMRRAARAFWPPPASSVAQLLKLGFNDTKQFILDNDLIQCERCFRATKFELQPIYNQITPTISPAASPAVSRAPSFRRLAGAAPALRASKRRSSPLPPIKIKDHRRQATAECHFETSRKRSGIKIKRKALERLRSESDLEQLKSASFASKLREKLQQVAATAKTADGDETKAQEKEKEKEKEPAERSYRLEGRKIEMPTIVIEELPSDVRDEQPPGGATLTKPRASSVASSVDSALGPELQTPSCGGPEGPMSSSPAEKFLAGSRKPRAQSISLAGSAPSFQLEQQASEGGRKLELFVSAPSPLPSCPPSPNLNRHCSECIRLRQRARMDDLDESIQAAVERYSQVKSKDSEREFNSIRWKLACWLNRLGSTKYSYSISKSAETSAEELSNSDLSDDSGELGTMAEMKARRKASHPFAWPAAAAAAAASASASPLGP